MKLPVLFFVVCIYTLLFNRSGDSQPTNPPEEFSYTVVNCYPHDRAAFTQGLALDKGNIYESTGLNGRSSLRQIELKTGRIKQRLNFAQHVFAEGITVFDGSIYQLTWKNNLVLQYDKKDFSLIRSWRYPRQGWGITHDNRSLIVSDGTANLYFLDPTTLTEQRRISVHDGKRAITRLNELEYIRGSVYANIWKTNQIALINPKDGTVTGWLDLTKLCKQVRSGSNGKNVLNGIMYDPVKERLFITGKLWPALFEIRLVQVRQSL